MTRCHKSGGISGALGGVLHSSVLGLPVVPGAAPRSAVSTCVCAGTSVPRFHAFRPNGGDLKLRHSADGVQGVVRQPVHS